MASNDENDLPDELKPQAAWVGWNEQRQREMIAKMESEHDAFLSEFTMFVADLTADQARFVKTMLEVIGDAALRAELAGIVMGYMVWSMGLTVQGKDANEEFRKLLEESDTLRVPTEKEEALNDVLQEEADRRKEIDEQIERDLEEQAIRPTPPDLYNTRQTPPDEIKVPDGNDRYFDEVDFKSAPEEDYAVQKFDGHPLMQQYNLENRYTSPTAGGDGQWAGVRCKGCKQDFLNLAHRMENEPGVEGCKGCQYIAKWGG